MQSYLVKYKYIKQTHQTVFQKETNHLNIKHEFSVLQ